MTMLSLTAVFLCSAMFIMTVGGRRIVRTENPSKGFTNVCGNQQCGGVRYEDILRVYPGILFTLEELQQIQRQRGVDRLNILDKQGYKQTPSKPLNMDIGDGDACCATDMIFSLNYTLTNLYGYEKSIVHMPDVEPQRYQYIPHGTCVIGYGSCIGTCLIEPIILTLLVVEGESLTFDFFQVPGYCSCKNF